MLHLCETETLIWELIIENCTGRGICADVCEYEAIHMPREEAYPCTVTKKCVGCLKCKVECPFGAIKVEVQARKCIRNRGKDKSCKNGVKVMGVEIQRLYVTKDFSRIDTNNSF